MDGMAQRAAPQRAVPRSAQPLWMHWLKTPCNYALQANFS
jgi:hypothetical protein